MARKSEKSESAEAIPLAAPAEESREESGAAVAMAGSGSEPDSEAVNADPLASPSGRAWLNNELKAAEYEAQHGPGGQGWEYNETLRAGIVERAEFLRALVDLLN